MEYIQSLKRFTRNLGILLAICCLLTCIVNCFSEESDTVQVLSLILTVITLVVSLFIGFIAMVQVYNNVGEGVYMPGIFWLVFSCVTGLILALLSCIMWMHLVDLDLSLSIFYGLSPALIPSIGVFIGDAVRRAQGKRSAAINV